MLSKRQIVRLKNLQPAAPRRHAAPYYKTKEEFAEISVQKKKKRKKKQPRKKKKHQQVADDQDRNNPAYVPRNKDYFYHDLRWTNDTVPRSEKHHIEVQGRWKHDKFRKKDQAPKSAEELIATYGFDIRARKNP